MKSVLVVTHQRGFEADPVMDALRSRSIPVFRFNCDSGDDVSRVSLLIGAGNKQVVLECDGLVINGEDIGVGWCQQLPPYLGQPADTRQSLQNENLWAAHFAVFDALDLPWFNKPSNVVRAANKALQLLTAQSVGLNFSATLISNAPQQIRDFAGNRSTVAKNLATPWVVSDQETYAAYTKLVTSDWLADDKGLTFCPIIYQTYQPRKKDYRVVAVGDRIFAASCEPGENQREDIRRGTTTGAGFIACVFDPHTIQRLMTLMKAFSIEYCAADFMEDEAGNLYFLEMNVCGAWWWVDSLYGGEICRAITEYLQRCLQKNIGSRASPPK